jgi:ParB family transcriptional regulator, chromosome partitioning protein
MTMDKRRALGRGLDALLPTVPATSSSGASYGERSVFLCPIEALSPQSGQPRQHIDEARLEELAASIREHGLIEPLVVRRIGVGNDRFEIVAGERRWRASQRAGLKDVLVVVKDVTPKTAFELALIENIQREDLGPIEVAEAFDRLIREHEYTHEILAERLHKDRTTVTNALRLLKLPTRVRSMVVEGKLSEGHARALLGMTDAALMESLADKVVRGQLSVRKVEELVRATRPAAGKTAKTEAATRSANVRDLETKLTRHMGLKVDVRDSGNKGEVAIKYSNLDEFDRILQKLGMG